MAKEAQAVGVYHQRQVMLEKEAAKMFEVIPGRIGGNKDCTQEFSGMVIHGQQEGLLLVGGPPLVDGGIVLPQFIDARAFPSTSGFGTRFRLADEAWKVGSGKGGHRLSVALKSEVGLPRIRCRMERVCAIYRLCWGTIISKPRCPTGADI